MRIPAFLILPLFFGDSNAARNPCCDQVDALSFEKQYLQQRIMELESKLYELGEGAITSMALPRAPPPASPAAPPPAPPPPPLYKPPTGLKIVKRSSSQDQKAVPNSPLSMDELKNRIASRQSRASDSIDWENLKKPQVARTEFSEGLKSLRPTGSSFGHRPSSIPSSQQPSIQDLRLGLKNRPHPQSPREQPEVTTDFRSYLKKRSDAAPSYQEGTKSQFSRSGRSHSVPPPRRQK